MPSTHLACHWEVHWRFRSTEYADFCTRSWHFDWRHRDSVSIVSLLQQLTKATDHTCCSSVSQVIILESRYWLAKESQTWCTDQHYQWLHSHLYQSVKWSVFGSRNDWWLVCPWRPLCAFQMWDRHSQSIPTSMGHVSYEWFICESSQLHMSVSISSRCFCNRGAHSQPDQISSTTSRQWWICGLTECTIHLCWCWI